MAAADKDIYDYVVANLGNPQAIADAAKQFNVSAEDLSRATGQDLNVVNSYFANANVTPYWAAAATNNTGITSLLPAADTESVDLTQIANTPGLGSAGIGVDDSNVVTGNADLDNYYAQQQAEADRIAAEQAAAQAQAEAEARAAEQAWFEEQARLAEEARIAEEYRLAEEARLA